jgi:hypothetical protein
MRLQRRSAGWNKASGRGDLVLEDAGHGDLESNPDIANNLENNMWPSEEDDDHRCRTGSDVHSME